MLKSWLQYSKTGQLDAGTVTDKEPDSEFEEFVIDAINRLEGFEAVPQIGVSGYFIDIGVKHQDFPDGFLLGVECDGASYHSSKSARDRDRLRQDVLEGLGWKFIGFGPPAGLKTLLGKQKLHSRLKGLKENCVLMPNKQNERGFGENADSG